MTCCPSSQPMTATVRRGWSCLDHQIGLISVMTWVVWIKISLKGCQGLPATLGHQQLVSGCKDFSIIRVSAAWAG